MGKQNRKQGEVFSDAPDRNMTCYVSDKGAYHHSLLVAVQSVLTKVQLNDLNQSSGLLHSDAGRRIIQDTVARIACELIIHSSAHLSLIGNHTLETKCQSLQVASLRAGHHPIVRQMVLQLPAILS
jgi:hypothetical protein